MMDYLQIDLPFCIGSENESVVAQLDNKKQRQ